MKGNSKKAFSILEVLLAASIFAIIMLIATAVLARSSTYQGKLDRMRATSEEARRISDLITREIKSANTTVKLDSEYQPLNSADICDSGTDEGTEITFSGFAILSWRREFDPEYVASHSHCAEYFNSNGIVATPTRGHYDSRMLIVSTNLKTIVYETAKESANGRYRLYRKEFNPNTKLTIANLTGVVSSSNAISDPNYDVSVGFGGYAPILTSTAVGKPALEQKKSQPLVKFLVTVQDKDYKHTDNSDPSLRVHSGEQAVIRSIVTSRNYK